MKDLKKILCTFALVIGASMAVSAQKHDQKKPPPKGDPPVIPAPDKTRPRDDKPKGDKGGKGGKKPGMAYVLVVNRSIEETA